MTTSIRLATINVHSFRKPLNRENNVHDLVSILKPLNLHLLVVQKMSLPYSVYGPTNGNAAGNGIASIYPIRSYLNQHVILMYQGGTRLVIQYCLESIENVTFAVTHLDHLDEDVRLEQIRKFNLYEQNIDIIMGDMNALTRDDYSDEYFNEIIVDKREKLINSQAKDKEIMTCVYGTRIDYIYVHPRLNDRWKLQKCSIIDTQGVTDHHAVFAEFEINV